MTSSDFPPVVCAAGPAVSRLKPQVPKTFLSRWFYTLAMPRTLPHRRQIALDTLCRLFPDDAWFYRGIYELALHDGFTDPDWYDRLLAQESALRARACGLS